MYPDDFECVACGRPCQNGLRWCSDACFRAEDGDDRELDDELDDDDED